MRSCFLSVLVFLLLVTQALADTSQFFNDLQRELEVSLQHLKIPGAIVVVENDAGSKWTGVAGVAEYPDTPMTADLSLYIASVTKTMTATIVLQLVDQGKLTLDTVLESLFPGIVVNSSKITMRHLLGMHSGLGSYLSNPQFLKILSDTPKRVWTPAELVEYSNWEVAAPGTVFDYNNANYILLGMIIEKLTGISYAENIRTRIVVPLGLQRTYVQESLQIPFPHAHGYNYDEGVLRDATYSIDPSPAGAAGSVVSTGRELMQWVKALIRGDLISSQMQKERLDLKPTANPNMTYGLGILSWNGAIGHNGEYYTYFTAWAGRYKGWYVTILCNGQALGGNDKSSALGVFFWLRDHVTFPGSSIPGVQILLMDS